MKNGIEKCRVKAALEYEETEPRSRTPVPYGIFPGCPCWAAQSDFSTNRSAGAFSGLDQTRRGTAATVNVDRLRSAPTVSPTSGPSTV